MINSEATNTLLKCCLTSIALGVVSITPASAATLLEATLEFSTPTVNPEVEDEIDFKDGGSGSKAEVRETIDSSDRITFDFNAGGGSTANPGPDDYNRVFNDTTVIPNNSFHASGSATASFDRLATDAFWFGSEGSDYTNGAPGGTIRAESTVADEITVSGDGKLTFNYLLSGSVAASMITDNERLRLRDQANDTYTNFDAEFRISDGGITEIAFRLQQPGDDDTNIYSDSFFDRALSLSIDVEDGDLVYYSAKARSWIDFDRDSDISKNFARTDFGSTAVLSSVEVTDGLSFTAFSGFDYLSVDNASTGPEDPTGVVPLPAGVWLLLTGIIGIGGLRRFRT